MKKRLFTVLLALILVLSLFPAQAMAIEEDTEYKIGDTLETEGTAAPTAEIPENTRWEQQGEAQQRRSEEPGCGKTPHAHGDGSSCDLHCTLEAHTHVINCPADCSLHVHNQDCCKATHIHGTGCNCQTEEHSHNDSCYGNCPTHACTEECQIPEGGTCPSIHTHSESCVPACGKEPHTHSDDCCTAVHEHSDQCIPGCGQEDHTHITGGCGGEGICTIPEHAHGDGSSCQMECTLQEHEHEDECYELITYTTWKVVQTTVPDNGVALIGNGPNHQRFTVTYDNKTIILGLGTIQEDALHLFAPGIFGDYYPVGAEWPFQYQLVLGAYEQQNNGNEAIGLAPSGLYDCISNVTVTVVSCQNEDGTPDPYCFLVNDPSTDTPATTLQAGIDTSLNVNMPSIFVMADPGNCFEADLKVTFDLKLPGEAEATTYSIDTRAGYWGPNIFEITAPDTAEELNTMLSSFDNLVTQLPAAQQEKLDRCSRSPGPENPLIYIKLPEADYNAPIIYNLQIPQGKYIGNIELYGAGNGKTTMSGLEINGYITHLYDIDFVYNGTTDSGISVNPDEIGGVGNIESVRNCSFTGKVGNTGYTYGIRNEGINFVRGVRNCVFANCEYGLYMDCAEADDYPNINDGDNHHNIFRNCRYAVRVVNLPDQISSYLFRMADSIFENNHKDFHITTPGNKHYYYFYRNYYDGVYSNAAPALLLSDSDTFRAANIDVGNSEAVVVTNPCRTSATGSTLWVFGGDSQYTRMSSAEAKNMKISGDAFTSTKEIEKTITITSDNDKNIEVATWIFGGADE